MKSGRVDILGDLILQKNDAKIIYRKLVGEELVNHEYTLPEKTVH